MPADRIERPSPVGPALRALRDATAARHARLDARLPIAAPDAGLETLRAHLRLLHAWIGPLERWAARHGDGPQDPHQLPPRPRAARLAAGLRAIDAHAPAAPAAPIPASAAAAAWPRAGASAAYRWGVAYVVEGAQLGGAVLAARLAPRLPADCLAVLRDAPEAGGARWPRVLAALEAALDTPVARAEACAGACDAFDALLALAGLDVADAA